MPTLQGFHGQSQACGNLSVGLVLAGTADHRGTCLFRVEVARGHALEVVDADVKHRATELRTLLVSPAEEGIVEMLLGFTRRGAGFIQAADHTENGFFLPNERKKYSVGENAGMQLDDDGGIEIHIAAEQPDGVPAANWLPMPRGDYGVDAQVRLYVPDLERYATWQPPMATRR